jgi:general secretion pathway protein M
MIARLRALPSPWWDQRSPRERVLLAALLAVLVCWLGIVLVARPLLNARAEALASIARSEMALARLAAAPAPALPVESSGQLVPAILTETATEFGMTIRRIEPEADGAQLTIDDAAFDDVLRWIEALEVRHGLHVVALKMDRSPAPGVVSASLTVRR